MGRYEISLGNYCGGVSKTFRPVGHTPYRTFHDYVALAQNRDIK